MILRSTFPPLLCLALGCASAGSAPKAPPPAAAAPATAVPASPPGGGAPGIDVAGMDRSVAPGDDFFLFANGSWIRQAEIPADSSRWGTFNALAEETMQRSRALLEAAASGNAPAGSEERKVGDLYASYLDEATVEARGLQPLRPQLAAIAALGDRSALARALGAELRTDVDALNATHYH